MTPTQSKPKCNSNELTYEGHDDITDAHIVEIQLAKDVTNQWHNLWVNVDGQCRLRIEGIQHVQIDILNLEIKNIGQPKSWKYMLHHLFTLWKTFRATLRVWSDFKSRTSRIKSVPKMHQVGHSSSCSQTKTTNLYLKVYSLKSSPSELSLRLTRKRRKKQRHNHNQ